MFVQKKNKQAASEIKGIVYTDFNDNEGSVPEANVVSVAQDTTQIERKKKEPNSQNSLLLNLTVLIAFIIANILYLICDRKCPYDDATVCAKTFIFPNLTKWAVFILISAVIFVTIIYKSFIGKISRAFAILAIVNIIYLSFFYHPILNAREYGQMFGFFLLSSVLASFVVLGIGLSFRYCYRKTVLVLIIIPIVFIILGFYFYFAKVKNSCSQWSSGLGNGMIINDGDVCSIETPKFCVYEVTDGWFDLTRISGDCSRFSVNEDIMERYFSDAPVIGFPRTENFPDSSRLPIQEEILKRFIPLSSMNEAAAADIEIFLDKTTADPSIKIDVKRNETLVEERGKIQHEGLVKNVLVIYIDALSRVNALRKLKKTMSWFESHMNNQDSKADAFQFFRYHSIAPFTWPNLYEALYGKHPSDPTLSQENPLPSFLKSYKDNGYITGHATDFCQTSPLDIRVGDPIQDIPYDHEAISIACDPHYHKLGTPYGVFTGPYSSVRRCLYKQDVFEFVYEYGDQFWRKYKDEKKILYLDFLDAHEGTNEIVKYMDDALYNFLNGLEKDSLLDDTAIIFYADHGLHMQGIFTVLEINQVFSELSLPTFYTIFPKTITAKYGESIKTNEQRLFSAHEVHHVFKTLAEGDKSESLKSSLFNTIGSKRSCLDIGLTDGKCACTYN